MTTAMVASQLVNLMLSPPMQTPHKGRCAGQVTGASQHANGFVKGISYALRPGDLPFSAAASERALSLLCTAEAEQRKPPQQRGTGRPGQRDRHRCAAESGATGMPGLREALEIGLAEPPGYQAIAGSLLEAGALWRSGNNHGRSSGHRVSRQIGGQVRQRVRSIGSSRTF